MKKIIFLLAVLFVFGGCAAPANEALEEPIKSTANSDPKIEKNIYYPLANFEENVTLKPFGIYITPKLSPVNPEKFTGYHTGADSEIPENKQLENIHVYAIADGEVLLARYAGGYGGVIAIKHEIRGIPYVAIYGHLKLSSIQVSAKTKVKAGESLGVLGKGFSKETDGERKHLHFALKQGGLADLRGYVSLKSELGEWIDPVAFLKEKVAISPE